MNVYRVEAPASPLEGMNSPFDGPFSVCGTVYSCSRDYHRRARIDCWRYCNRLSYEILGGTAETGEDLRKALVREISEEAFVEIDLDDAEFFGYYFDRADGNDRPMMTATWLIGGYKGMIRRNREIAHIAGIASTTGLPKGSTLE